MVDEEGEAGHGHEQELHAECVVVAVVRGAELGEHEVHGGHGRRDEDHLHRRVVERHKVGEEIQVAADEHQRKHDLRLARDACTKKSAHLTMHSRFRARLEAQQIF